MTTFNAENFKKVIRALKDAKGIPGFDMTDFTHSGLGKHPCGTPACVLGHFGDRTDLQDVLYIDDSSGQLRAQDRSQTSWSAIQKYLGIEYTEAMELFGSEGCGKAKTRPQAIKYLEGFLKKKRREMAVKEALRKLRQDVLR